MPETSYPTLDVLEAGLDAIRRSPKDGGTLQLIVRRPRKSEREVVEEAELDMELGLVGDNWRFRRSSSSPDGKPNPDTQINIMNVRAIDLIAGNVSRWPLAGDQLYIDLDLSTENVPPGTQLQIGSACLQVTSEPHTGCRLFSERFGPEALRFVNQKVGRELNLRGINARVVQSGGIRTGDRVQKI